MSDRLTFGTFGRYTEIPVDQMTPALEGRIVTGQARRQTIQPMPGGGAR